MFTLKPSTIETYVYNKNTNGSLIGGYPLKTIAHQEEFSKNMVGGGLAESIGLEKFNDYAIPIGLFTCHDNTTTGQKKEKKMIDVISDDMFDKMFTLISKKRTSTTSNTKKAQKQDKIRFTKKIIS